MLHDDLESVVSSSDVKAFSNLMVQDENNSREETTHTLNSLVGKNLSRPPPMSAIDELGAENDEFYNDEDPDDGADLLPRAS